MTTDANREDRHATISDRGLPRSGSATRDRAQTVRRRQPTSARRDGKPAQWPAPAV
jgi:hypothetical protein